MIKNLIKKIIMWECKEFEITPKEAMLSDITAIVAVIIIAVSVRPFFGLVELLIKL